MYTTIKRVPKKVTVIKDIWDLKVDSTGKISLSNDCYERFNMKDNNFILAVNPENASDIALQISETVTDDSFYITTAGAKRAKNKSFKDALLLEKLNLIGGNSFSLVHTEDNYYKIHSTEALSFPENLVEQLNNTPETPEPVVELVEEATNNYEPF